MNFEPCPAAYVANAPPQRADVRQMETSDMNLKDNTICSAWIRTIFTLLFIAVVMGLGIICSGCIAGGSGYSMNYAPTNMVLGQPVYVELEIHPRSRYELISRRDNFLCFYRSDSDSSYHVVPLSLISKTQSVIKYGCELPALTTSTAVLEYYFSYTAHGSTNQTKPRQITLTQDDLSETHRQKVTNGESGRPD